MPSKARNVIISGLTAAGKTTHCKLLSKEYGLQYISASQIMLEMAGLSTQQSLDFWVMTEGIQLPESVLWQKVDEELSRIEAYGDNIVFDCRSLPWLRTRECMVIWLESSLPSRVMKALVSYKGESNLTPIEVEERIRVKDQLDCGQMLQKYSVDMFQDRTPFNLIVDISSFIIAPTDAASRISVTRAHEIISSAVGWYLYEDNTCWGRLQSCRSVYGDQVIQRYPEQALGIS